MQYNAISDNMQDIFIGRIRKCFAVQIGILTRI